MVADRCECEFDPRVAILRLREQDRGVYREAWRTVALTDGTRVRALSYLVNEKHPQFAGRLDVAEQVKLVARSRGESGRNTEYVRNTAKHLLKLEAEGRADHRIKSGQTRYEAIEPRAAMGRAESSVT